MKNKVLLFTILSLFLLIGGVGCDSDFFDHDYFKVKVVYNRCDYSADYINNGEISLKDILLFNLAYTEESDIITRFSRVEEIKYIIYDPDAFPSDHFIYRGPISNLPYQYCRICNFPIEIIEKCHIPENGLYISFSGDYVVTNFALCCMNTYDITLKS